VNRAASSLWIETIKQTILLLAIASIPAAATVAFDLEWKAPAEFKQLKPSQAKQTKESLVWVDVRSEDRFATGHIHDAVHFDETNPSSGLDAVRALWTPMRKVVVYGEGAGSDRALRVARLLKEKLPTKQVLLLEGGWAGWPRTEQTQSAP